MVKVMYNDQIVYKVVIWVSLWKEKVALTKLKIPTQVVCSAELKVNLGQIWSWAYRMWVP